MNRLPDISQTARRDGSCIGRRAVLLFPHPPAKRRRTDDRQQLFNAAFESSMNFAEALEGWFILAGPSGSGKTALAAAIANRVIERGMAVLFMVIPDLLDYLRHSYGNSTEESYDYIHQQVRDAPLLVLDGLGLQAATVWAQEKLFQVLNHRYNVGIPTVLTV